MPNDAFSAAIIQSMQPMLAAQQAYAEKVIAAHPAQPLIAENSLILSPCITRESWIRQNRAWLEKYYLGGRTGSSDASIELAADRALYRAKFDGLGCMVRASDRMRCYEPCLEGGIAVPDEGIGILDVFRVAMPILSKLIPVIGGAVTSLIAPLIKEALGQFSKNVISYLSEEMQNLVTAFKAAAQKFFADVRGAIEEVKKTFGTLGITSKSLADALKPAIALVDTLNPQTLLSYTASREALSFGASLLGGQTPSIKMLDAMAVGACMNVRDYASAKIWQGSKMSLVSLQFSTAFLANKRGELTPTKLRDFLHEMPPAEQVVTHKLGGTAIEYDDQGRLKPEVRDKLAKAFVGEPLELSNGMSDTYGGKPAIMTRSFDPNVLAALIPENLRQIFLYRTSDAVTFDAILMPYLKKAEQDFAADLSHVGYQLDDLNREANRLSGPALMERQKALRTEIEDAQHRANATIQAAISLYQGNQETGYSNPQQEAISAYMQSPAGRYRRTTP